MLDFLLFIYYIYYLFLDKDDKNSKEVKLLKGELASVQELRFAFKRASSRLTEMQGIEYKTKCEIFKSGNI